ncbi:MAG: hypothetical protein J0I88_10600, partial [Chryseobacterium sp.]|nr:hypothetical protein [Chryseobacterium sp.]
MRHDRDKERKIEEKRNYLLQRSSRRGSPFFPSACPSNCFLSIPFHHERDGESGKEMERGKETERERLRE